MKLFIKKIFNGVTLELSEIKKLKIPSTFVH